MTETIPDFETPTVAPDAESMFSTPDHTKSRNVPPGIKRAIGKLGANKKVRGGPRPLKPDDIQRIEDYYDMLAWAVTAYKPDVALAIRDEVTVSEDEDGTRETATRARLCAEAWGELAKENDSVRRVILFMVETGAWSKVMMLNLPIIVAALPDDALSRLMFHFMPHSAADDSASNSGNWAA